MTEFYAGRVDDYADGDRKVIECGKAEIGIFRVGGAFHAWHNRCAHLAGPVCQGRLLKRVLEPVDAEGCVRSQRYDENEDHIVCPWHGYEYSIRTGQHAGNPAIRLRRAELEVRDGAIFVHA